MIQTSGEIESAAASSAAPQWQLSKAVILIPRRQLLHQQTFGSSSCLVLPLVNNNECGERRRPGYDQPLKAIDLFQLSVVHVRNFPLMNIFSITIWLYLQPL